MYHIYNIRASYFDYVCTFITEFHIFIGLYMVICFLSAWRTPLAFLARQVSSDELSKLFCLGKDLSPFHLWRTAFPGQYSWLTGFSQYLNVSFHFLLACYVSVEKPTDHLMWTYLYVTSLFFLAASKFCLWLLETLKSGCAP